MEKKVTCRDIEAGVMQLFRREKRCCPIAPNLVLPHGWEADVAAITKTGFCHELEIKTSKSDFKADFQKHAYHRDISKHDRMAQRMHGKAIPSPENDHGTKNGWEPSTVWTPNYFWFCAPIGLLDISDIPEYAGLLEFNWKRGHSRYLHLNIVETKNAPRLHKNRTDTDHLKNEFLKRLTNVVAFGRGSNYNAIPDKITTKKETKAMESQILMF